MKSKCDMNRISVFISQSYGYWYGLDVSCWVSEWEGTAPQQSVLKRKERKKERKKEGKKESRKEGRNKGEVQTS